MSKLDARDRLQPSLLDRLLDDAPAEQKESVEDRVLDRQQLRQAVLRDLAWLLNAVRLQSDPASDRRATATEWEQLPEARRSVLNYGVPALTGMTLSAHESQRIQKGIVQAIRDFEPRIDANTLEVRLASGKGGRHNVLQLQIKGQLWSQPVPLELVLAAELDVETGSARVRDLRG